MTYLKTSRVRSGLVACVTSVTGRCICCARSDLATRPASRTQRWSWSFSRTLAYTVAPWWNRTSTSMCFPMQWRRLQRSSLATTSTVTASRSIRNVCTVVCQSTASSSMTRSSRQRFRSVTHARQSVQAKSKLRLAAEVPKEK
jgi:hypothetical protein